jgi:hypothetical protein
MRGLLAILLLSTGCYTVNAELPGTLRNDVEQRDLETVGALKLERTHWFAIDGLVGKPPNDIFSAEIKAQVQKKGADGVANLVYESEHTCGDVAIGVCSLGCLTPRTYRLSGDIVRIKAPRVPGRPAKLVNNNSVARASAPALLAQRY